MGDQVNYMVTGKNKKNLKKINAIKINYGINIFEYYVKCRSEIENYKEQIFVLHGVHL